MKLDYLTPGEINSTTEPWTLRGREEIIKCMKNVSQRVGSMAVHPQSVK